MSKKTSPYYPSNPPVPSHHLRNEYEQTSLLMGKSASSSSSSSSSRGDASDHMVVRVPPFFIPGVRDTLQQPGSMPAGASVAVGSLHHLPSTLHLPVRTHPFTFCLYLLFLLSPSFLPLSSLFAFTPLLTFTLAVEIRHVE